MIKRDVKGAEKLLGKLQADNGVWEAKDHVYKLSKSQSTGRLFIQRFPRRGSVV